jgi:hypothetical protein
MTPSLPNKLPLRLTFLRQVTGGLLTALLSLFASGLAQAHPGHSWSDASPAHLLTSPYHLVLLAWGGATIFFAARWVERRAGRRLLQGLGVAALTTAAVLWSLG